MDDLDRLYHRLVTNVRDGAPHLLDRQFHLGDVAAHLVPYRHSRRDLGFESIQQYEQALLRLASGERGYLRVEAAVQDAMRRSLAEPQPDGSLLRAHANALVALPPDALVRARVAPLPAGTSGAGASGTTPAVEVDVPTPPPAAAVADLERAVVASSQAADAWSEPPGRAAAPPTPAHRAAMTNPTSHPAVAPAPSAAAHGGAGGTCRYCGQPLPEGRRVTFCPYCGNNVTVLQCPACSTELEVGWKFCITCGRAMDDAAFAGDGAAGGAGGVPPGTGAR